MGVPEPVAKVPETDPKVPTPGDRSSGDQSSGDRASGKQASGDRASGGRDAAVVSRFVERFAAQLVEAGMPRMPSRVFAALLASDDGAMTSAELGETLRISPAAVSGAVRYLSQVHMLSREREPGSRRERYRVHTDQWYEALTSRDSVMKRWDDALREGVESLGPRTPAGRRLEETAAFFAFVRDELDAMMERWRAYRRENFG